MNFKPLVLAGCFSAALFATDAAVASVLLLDGTVSDNIHSTFQLTSTDSSIVATFANPLKETAVTNVYFYSNGTGLGLGSGGLVYSWTVSFNKTVTLTDIALSFSFDNDGFDISGLGVNVNDLMAGAGTGTTHLTTPITFQGNELYTFTSNNLCANAFGCGGVIFSEWDFASNSTQGTSVPEPASLALLGLGLAGVGIYRRKNLPK